MKRIPYLIAFAGLWLAASGFLKIAPSAVTPPDLYLLPSEKITTNPYYDKICESRTNPALFEKAKIQFLIAAIRQSPYKFVRNGTVHTSAMAARHVFMKYSYAIRQVKTSEEFIVKVASRSNRTNEEYLVRLDEKTAYPARDLLFNELKRLEQILADKGCS